MVIRKREKFRHLAADIAIILVSIALSVVLIKTGALSWFLGATRGLGLFVSFIAGVFFTSAFTVAPATVVLGGMAQEFSVLWVAVFGGLGALLGDFIIFSFVRHRLAEDFKYLLRKADAERFAYIFHLKLFRWLFQFVGAVVVASPLPDELGLAMLGLSKMRPSLFIPLSFFLNSVGILVIGLIARAL